MKSYHKIISNEILFEQLQDSKYVGNIGDILTIRVKLLKMYGPWFSTSRPSTYGYFCVDDNFNCLFFVKRIYKFFLKDEKITIKGMIYKHAQRSDRKVTFLHNVQLIINGKVVKKLFHKPKPKKAVVADEGSFVFV